MSNYGRGSLTGCLHTSTHAREILYTYIRFLSSCDYKSESPRGLIKMLYNILTLPTGSQLLQLAQLMD